MNFLFIIIIFFIASYVLETAIRKQLNVPKTVASVVPVNRVHKVGKNIILGLLIATLLISFTTTIHVLWIFLIIIFAQYLFDIIMQFKYARQTKEHLINLFFLIFYGLAAVAIYYVNPTIFSI